MNKEYKIPLLALFFGLCLSFILISCLEEKHDEENGLSIALTWQDVADKNTEVKDVHLWIFDADNGSLVEEKRYASAQEVASQRFHLAKGNYRILATANLVEPFYVSEATRAYTLDNVLIGLTAPKNVKNNAYFAYFGVVDAKVDLSVGNCIVRNPMKNVLPELTIVIENVPKGTEMSGKALDCAWCLFPTQKNGDGEYGLPSIDPTEVEMPTILATESTLQSEVIRLMPTLQGSPASHVYLRLLLPNEILQEFDITAPAMKAGGKYELRLNYNQMQPKMNLDATINNWKDLNDEVEIK